MSQVTSPAATVHKFANCLSFRGLYSQRPLHSQPATIAPLAHDSPLLCPMSDPASLKALHFTLEMEGLLAKAALFARTPMLRRWESPGSVRNGDPELTWTGKTQSLKSKHGSCFLSFLLYFQILLSLVALPAPWRVQALLCLDSLGFLGCLLSSPCSAKSGLQVAEAALQPGCC